MLLASLPLILLIPFYRWGQHRLLPAWHHKPLRRDHLSQAVRSLWNESQTPASQLVAPSRKSKYLAAFSREKWFLRNWGINGPVLFQKNRHASYFRFNSLETLIKSLELPRVCRLLNTDTMCQTKESPLSVHSLPFSQVIAVAKYLTKVTKGCKGLPWTTLWGCSGSWWGKSWWQEHGSWSRCILWEPTEVS